MKEIKQSHVTYLTILNLIMLLGVIVFFLRKINELGEICDEKTVEIKTLEKSLRQNSSHTKALFGKINKKISEKQKFIEEENDDAEEDVEIEISEKGDHISSAMKSLLS